MPEFKAGFLVTPSEYISQVDAGPIFAKWLARQDGEFIGAHGLREGFDIPLEMRHRIICMPTAAMVAINMLAGKPHFGCSDKLLTVEDLYRAGILAHTNDQIDESGNCLRKGYPSFHYRTGETYHRFVVDLARRFGLDGALIKDFQDTEFIHRVIDNRGIVILSVNNRFIPAVTAPEIAGKVTLTDSKHVEIFHAYADQAFLYTDVLDRREQMSWEARNRRCNSQEVDPFLTCPMKNDFSTRAIILAPHHSNIHNMRKDLEGLGTFLYPEQNPLLAWQPEAPLKEWEAEMLSYWHSDRLVQWDLIAHLQERSQGIYPVDSPFHSIH